MKKLALMALLCAMLAPMRAHAQLPRFWNGTVVQGTPVTVDIAVQDKWGRVRVPSLLTITCDNGFNTTVTFPGADDGMESVVSGSGSRTFNLGGIDYTTTTTISAGHVLYLTNGTIVLSPRCKTLIVSVVNATPHTTWFIAEYQ